MNGLTGLQKQKLKRIRANNAKKLAKFDDRLIRWSNTMRLPSKIVLRAKFDVTEQFSRVDAKIMTKLFKTWFAKMTASPTWRAVLASKQNTKQVATSFKSLPGGLMVGADFKPGMLNRQPVLVGLRILQRRPSLVVDLVLDMQINKSIPHRKETLKVMTRCIKQTMQQFLDKPAQLAGLTPNGVWTAKYDKQELPKKPKQCKLVGPNSDLNNMWLVMTFDQLVNETELVAKLAEHAKQTRQTKCMHCSERGMFDVALSKDVQDCYYVRKINIVDQTNQTNQTNQTGTKLVVVADLVAPIEGFSPDWLDDILFHVTRLLKPVLPSLAKIQLASQVAHSIKQSFSNKLAGWFGWFAQTPSTFVVSFYLVSGSQTKGEHVTKHIMKLLGQYSQYARSVRHSSEHPNQLASLGKYKPMIRIINILLVGPYLEHLQQRLDSQTRLLKQADIDKFLVQPVLL